MAQILIKIEKDDVKTSKIGANVMIKCGNIDLVFSPEAIEELIKDYNIILSNKGKSNNKIAQFSIGNVNVSDLIEILKSESVYKLLRFGMKSPSKAGIDDCNDDSYVDLYDLVCKIRKQQD